MSSFFLSLIFFAFQTQALASPLIRVLAKVEIDQQPTVTLGDITQFEDLSDEETAKIKAINLGEAPKPGESRYYTDVGLAQLLRSRLKALEGRLGEKVNLHIPSRITITRKALRLEAKVIEAELKKQLNFICGDCEFEIVQLSLPILNQDIPSGSTWALKLRSELPKGSFSIPLEIRNDDSTRRLFWISGNLQIKRPVPVAKRDIAIGEKIHPMDIATELRDITFANDVSADANEIKESYANRMIGANQIVWRSSVRRETATRPGELVKVITGSDGWQISVDGVAQQAGYIGDTINVKIPRTMKIITGLIREHGVVEVR